MDWIFALARLVRTGWKPVILVAKGNVVRCPVRGYTGIDACRGCPRFLEFDRGVLYCRNERPAEYTATWS